MSFVLRMAWRETRASFARLAFFFVCVALGVAAIIVLRSVVQNVRTTLTREARSLVGADIVIQSRRPFSADVLARITTALAPAGAQATTDVIDTQTMASPVEGQGNGGVKLVELRGVQDGFPFYGALELGDGQLYSHRLLVNHGALVQPELLVAFGLRVGDRIKLAGQEFTVRGEIARDRVQRGGIAFGPRVYVDLADLKTTSLFGFGSRATYQLMLKVSDDATERLTEGLKTALKQDVVGVRSWMTLEDRIGQNLTLAENYLSLVGFAIVVLGGIGVWSVTRVIVQQKIRSVAILKCLGATSGRVLAAYLIQVLWLAATGSLLGLGIAAAALAAIPASVLEPLGVTSVWVTPSAAAQGAAVGLLVSLLFALVPLLEIRAVKPLLLLRVDTTGASRKRDWRSLSASAAIGVALVFVAMWQADSVRAGLYVSIGLGAVAALLSGVSRLLIVATRPLARSPTFAIRHAVVSLSRPGNQTRVILMAVGLGCFFILGVRALQANILHELSSQVGQNSPDLVLIDVQEDQVDSLKAVVAPFLREPARLMPMMRARVISVDGKRLHLPTLEAVRENGHMTREFGLTFRDGLERNEQLIAGTLWPGGLTTDRTADGFDTEVSIEKNLRDETGLEVGDAIVFDVAGRQLRARVSSVRAVVWEQSQNGGFVFVLRPGPAVLRTAHNYVGFLEVTDSPAARGDLQRALVRSHPNVSVIDVRDVLASIRDVVDNVTFGVTIVGAVTLFGGTLILVGAVATTKFQKLYESAIYRTLGASSRMVAAMVTVEYGLLGLLAGLAGALGALGLSWGLARFLFKIDWQPAPLLLFGGVAVTAVLVAVVGLASSVDVVIRKPLATLRNE
ncbi:MAG: FtsX-like permease family protein [Acidobacteriota bacterium]